jgi:hypothetical protein
MPRRVSEQVERPTLFLVQGRLIMAGRDYQIGWIRTDSEPTYTVGSIDGDAKKVFIDPFSDTRPMFYTYDESPSTGRERIRKAIKEHLFNLIHFPPVELGL